MQLNKIYNENCLETMQRMEDNSINCVVTSPPYWGLRDYGHEEQLGLEKTMEEYVARMVEIFREVRRVLKKEGTLWLNLGDSYNTKLNPNGISFRRDKAIVLPSKSKRISRGAGRWGGGNANDINLKAKDLIGIPWRVAFALQADGWWLRQDIIWSKPNPMPESVKDRCTKSHEYIFLLTKSGQYFYDMDAIKEPASFNTHERVSRAKLNHKSMPNEKQNGVRPRKSQKIPSGWDMGPGSHNKKNGRYPKIKNNPSFDAAMQVMPDDRNKRSVWEITTQPFPEAHFAVFPEKIPALCILAGCPEGGIVYDPFMGAATTALAALKYGRQFIGSEINPEYCEMGEKRIKPYIDQLNLAI